MLMAGDLQLNEVPHWFPFGVSSHRLETLFVLGRSQRGRIAQYVLNFGVQALAFTLSLLDVPPTYQTQITTAASPFRLYFSAK